MKGLRKQHNLLWLKVYIFFVLLLSFFLIGIYILAAVEETPSVLKEWLGSKVMIQEEPVVCPNFVNGTYLTIKDQCTGLVWARRELPSYKISSDPTPGYTWDEADSACKALAPTNMFRLPTVEELKSLVHYRCDATDCFAKAEITSFYGAPPILSDGIYWSSSDFHEDPQWINVNATPKGTLERDYKRSVNLLTGEVDSPVFGKNMRLNVWCIVAKNPEVVEKKYTNVVSGNITNGQKANSGTIKTIFHRDCNTNCSVIGATACESIAPVIVTPICGDILCDSGENCSSCQSDCGPCPICIGTVPSNANLCSGDNLGLLVDTTIQLVPACSISTDITKKCEYICKPGFAFSNGICVPPPAITITVNPTSINSGQTATLTWSTTNADSCTASWGGTPGISGSTTVNPTSTTTYTLTCTGPAGTTSNSAQLTVSQPVIISGHVDSAKTGASLAGVAIQLTGTTTYNTTTDASGNYSITAIIGTYNLTAALTGYITGTINGINLTANTTQNIHLLPNEWAGKALIIVLKWNGPTDLDSHLLTPEPYHIYWMAKTSTNAALDLDNMSSNGIETVTINSLLAGTYHYYVNDYIPVNGWTNNTTVSVWNNSGTLLGQYVSTATTSSYWDLFTINSGTITNVNGLTGIFSNTSP